MLCKNCQKEFVSKKIIQVYCSKKCNDRDRCKRYYKRNQEYQQKRVLSYYYELRKTEEGVKKIREINYRANSKRRFSVNNRKELLLTLGKKCFFCGLVTNNPVIHHLDKNGRNMENPNNNLENLSICCKSCHAKIHLLNKNLQMKSKSDTPGNRR